MTVQSQPVRNRLGFPAIVQPKLSGGRVHQVLIDDVGLVVSTLAGFNGHAENKPLLSIPRSQWVEIEYLPPRWWRGARCRLLYQTDQHEWRELTLKAVDDSVVVHNGLTGLAAQVLKANRDGDQSSEPIRYEYTLLPLRVSVKLLYLPAVLAIMILTLLLLQLGLNIEALGATAVVSVFFVCVAVGATIIDTIRLHTTWRWPVKVVVAVLAVIATLVLLGTAVTLLDIIA